MIINPQRAPCALLMVCIRDKTTMKPQYDQSRVLDRT